MTTPLTRGVLDTSTVVLLGELAAEDLPDEPLITAVTLAELSVGPLVASDDQERAARQARLQEAEADFEERIPNGGASGGRKVQARAFDAMIAATAMANDLPVFTVNPSDFEGIAGLDLRPVQHPHKQ